MNLEFNHLLITVLQLYFNKIFIFYKLKEKIYVEQIVIM